MADSPRVPIRDRTSYLVIPLVVGLLSPFLIMVVSLLVAQRPPADFLAAIGERFVKRKLNIVILTVIGLPPFLILGGFSWWRCGKKGPAATFWPWLGGLLGILNLLLPVHAGFWPKYFRGASLGFPHGLELILGPVVSTVPMAFGMALGWLVWLTVRKKSEPTR